MKALLNLQEFCNDFYGLGHKFGIGEITLPEFIVRFKQLQLKWA